MIKHTGQDTPSGFRFELTQEERDAGFVALITGPISGTIGIFDGAENHAYDVTDDHIAVKAEHLGLLKLAIHKAHHAAGRFLDVPVPDVADVSL